VLGDAPELPGAPDPPVLHNAEAQAGAASAARTGSAAEDNAVPVPITEPTPASALGSAQHPLYPQNAAQERSRVRALHGALLLLQAALHTVPPGTKLYVFVLATSYIAHLNHTHWAEGLPCLHPPKWPMCSRLYTGPWGGPSSGPPGAATVTSSHEPTGLGDPRLAPGDGPP
uniref:Uncharacterized protein n=1 Tax=Amazona collaria TaxID=241587 RepID=A0A8B9ITV2_9PSIT